MTESAPTRRKFLERATLALGGIIGAFMAVPLVRYAFFPVGRKTVSSPEEPVDVLAADTLTPGAPPVRVTVTADRAQDAWTVARNVPLGAAWVRKTEAGQIEAFSTACPHLGCAIGYDAGANEYRCPCHKSAFGLDGEKLSGPSKRGLDPLPVEVEDGRVKITYLRFRPDIAGREKA